MNPEFTVEYRDPRELAAHPANFRRHPDAQKEALAASLIEHSWLSAPIWNKRSGHLLDGHARVELAVSGAEPLIPVRVIDVSEEKEKRILASYDRIGSLAEQDDGALAALLTELSESEAGLPAGWGQADLDALLKELGEPNGGLLPGADPDALPDEVETRCKSGELWQMGEHRLLCGDCTEAANIDRLMGRKRLQMVWTDPPYGVGYQDNESIESLQARNRRTDGKTVGNDSLSKSETERLVRDALALACEHGASGSSCYVACPPGTLLPHFIAAVAQSGFQFKHSLVWVKDQFVFGRADYHYRHELVLYGWKEGSHVFTSDRTQDSVFQIARPKRSADHPTMKPVELVRRMVENSSRPAEIVYDPFLGSGSTLIACEETGRSCYGCEIDPHYADVCLSRWEQAVGKSAERLE